MLNCKTHAPFSFNLGYMILGMCYLLRDLTFCKGLFFIQFIVFHWVMKFSGFVNLIKCSMVFLPL